MCGNNTTQSVMVVLWLLSQPRMFTRQRKQLCMKSQHSCDSSQMHLNRHKARGTTPPCLWCSCQQIDVASSFSTKFLTSYTAAPTLSMKPAHSCNSHKMHFNRRMSRTPNIVRGGCVVASFKPRLSTR